MCIRCFVLLVHICIMLYTRVYVTVLYGVVYRVWVYAFDVHYMYVYVVE